MKAFPLFDESDYPIDALLGSVSAGEPIELGDARCYPIARHCAVYRDHRRQASGHVSRADLEAMSRAQRIEWQVDPYDGVWKEKTAAKFKTLLDLATAKK